MGFRQRLDHAAHRGHIAAQVRLVIGRADGARFRGHHFQRFLRIGETLQSALAQGVEGDDLRAAIGGVTQAVQHARVVGARVLTKDENRVRVIEIIQTDSAFAHADAALQAAAARFVTHIGAVGEVVGADHAAKQLIEPGGFVAGAPGGVELHLIGVIHRVNMLGDQRESVVPADRLVMVGQAVIAQRFGQAALIFQKIVALRIEFAHAVGGEKLGVDKAARRFPGHRLGAVLTEAEGAFVVVAPGAARAVEAFGLIHAHQVTHIFQRLFAVDNETGRGFERAPAARRGLVRFNLRFKFHDECRFLVCMNC